MQSQVTENRPGKMNTTEGLCHHKVYASNKATGKVYWFLLYFWLWLWFHTTKG